MYLPAEKFWPTCTQTFTNYFYHKKKYVHIFQCHKMCYEGVIKASILFFAELNYVNLFHASDHFLYPLKTSENLWFSDVFRG